MRTPRDDRPLPGCQERSSRHHQDRHNAYCSCGALQADRCFTVRPVAIFCYVGEYVSLVHEALESKRLAHDWFEVSLREACDTVSRVLVEELVHASRDDSSHDVPMVCHTGKGRIG